MANLKLIRKLCDSKQITIRELAQRIDRDESTIQSAMRRGSTNTVTIEAIARVLGVSPGIFFEGYRESNSKELEREVGHLKELLKEKERLIEVLMKERSGNS